MALRFTGGLVFRTIKPIVVNPCLAVPSTLNLQVRYAARKGYREKAKQKKQKQKFTEIASKDKFKLRQKFSKIEKTVISAKPDPPSDDVFIAENFQPYKYSIAEAVALHQEFHHPTVFNNPSANIFARVEFNMTGKKKTQFLKPFKGLAPVSHPFSTGLKKEILVLCGPKHVDTALQCGARVAGGVDLVAKIKEGVVQPSLFEYILCHTEFFNEITPIRGLLKTQIPRSKSGTLTNDLETAIPKFLHGIEYNCVKTGSLQDFGLIDCQIGTIDMEPEQVDENFKCLIKDVLKFRPPRDGDFITYIWCRSPPSTEQFAIDIKRYVDDKVVTDQDDDEEENELTEKEETQKILQELREKEVQ